MPELNADGTPKGGDAGSTNGGEKTPEKKEVQPPPGEAKPDPRDVELQNLRQENDRAKRQVVTLVQRFKEAMDERNNGGGEDPDERQEKELKKFKERFEENPRQALDEHFEERLRPILEKRREGEILSNRERAFEKLVKSHGEEKVTKYLPEIEKFMGDMSPETLATPGAWEDAFRFVRSAHVDEEIEEGVKRRLKAEEPAEEEMLMERASRTVGGRSVKPRMSSLEKQIAKDMNMSEEEWFKFGGGSQNTTFGGPAEED